MQLLLFDDSLPYTVVERTTPHGAFYILMLTVRETEARGPGEDEQPCYLIT